MSKRRVRVTLLCEDKQHEVFFRRYLKGVGYTDRDVRSEPYPKGRGAAEQYVRSQYPRQVRALRQFGHQVALVVITDADRVTATERLRQLDATLQGHAPSQPRREDERIAVLIPRRNIETWIHWLLGDAVNEDMEYPRLTGRESECQPAVDRLVQLVESGAELPNDAPSSLRDALPTLRRIRQWPHE
jgi:hypothetical protein